MLDPTAARSIRAAQRVALSPAHTAPTAPQDCFSNLLDEGERIKVIRGAIAPSVVVSRIPHLVGPEGYAEMIRMWKAACPNVTSTINIMGEHIAGDATWILTKWTKSGTFTGAVSQQLRHCSSQPLPASVPCRGWT